MGLKLWELKQDPVGNERRKKKEREWRKEHLQAAEPPDALLMSKVSRSVSPVVAIKGAPRSSLRDAGMFINGAVRGGWR